MTEELKNVMEEITPEKGASGHFSKKKFEKLAKAMLNDPDYAAKVAVSSGKELSEVKDIAVSKEFRGFLKKVVEKAGIDKKESEMVLDPAFTIDNTDGLYDFMSEVIYQYMDAGNPFKFLPKEDFNASISVEKVAAGETTPRVARNPATGEVIGEYVYSNKEYKKLTASSPCPDWLKSRRKVD